MITMQMRRRFVLRLWLNRMLPPLQLVPMKL
jgi:hypothetical protein